MLVPPFFWYFVYAAIIMLLVEFATDGEKQIDRGRAIGMLIGVSVLSRVAVAFIDSPTPWMYTAIYALLLALSLRYFCQTQPRQTWLIVIIFLAIDSARIFLRDSGRTEPPGIEESVQPE